MKKSMKIVLPAIVLCIAIVLSVCMPSLTKKAADVEKVNPIDVATVAGGTVAAQQLSNVATQQADTKYAFGATVENGEWTFTYGGETFNNAYDYMLAADGFMYGVDWDWFSDSGNGNNGMGYDDINGYKSEYRPAYVTRTLYNLKALGVNALGCWTGPKACYTFDHDTGYVIGLDPQFVTALRAMLESCRETEMFFVPALLYHWYGENYRKEPTRGRLSAENTEFYFRFYHEEEARKEWLEHGIAEVCKILAEYQDVIPAVALTVENGSGTNDFDIGMMYSGDSASTTWESFASLQNNMHDVVKTYMPNTPTACEENGGWWDNLYKYNDLKVDLIGPQRYSRTGTSYTETDNEIYLAARRGYVGEFNYDWAGPPYREVTLEYLDNVMTRHYKNIMEAGNTGGFWFCVTQQYTNDRWSWFLEPNMDEYESMRNFAVPLSFIIHDLKQEHRGTNEVLTPKLFYNNDSETNYWVPVKGASYYRLERIESADGVNWSDWKVIGDNIDPMEYACQNSLIKYNDPTIEEYVLYHYRVVAVFDDGSEIVGDKGNMMTRYIPVEYFLDAEGNYDGSFERGDDMWKGSLSAFEQNGKSSNGWYKASGGKPGAIKSDPIADSETGARTGENYLHVGPSTSGENWAYGGQWKYYLTVPGNAKYELSAWSRNTFLSWDVTLSIHDAETNDTCGKVFCFRSVDPENTEADPNEWLRNYVQFTAPSHGKIYIKIMNGSKPLRGDTYIDDISIGESR
ncbi:MAG: hypothetical protein E7560_03595 [Ruminococcaceae bacterium]|nr:hypothetical protein [Oscillospiraceae bacterium]